MFGTTRRIGLAFVAIAALSSVAAPGAEAGKLDLGAAPAVLTGHSGAEPGLIFALTSTGGFKFSVKCSTSTFEGTTQGVSVEEATVTATWGLGKAGSEGQICNSLSEQSQVLMNGCKYTITGSGQAPNTYLVDIVGCTAGKQIEIKTTSCTVDIGEQNGLSHLFGQQISAQEIRLDATVTGVLARQTGAGCLDGNSHLSTNFSFEAITFVKAFKDSGTKQVTKHKHQYSEHLCGTQVSILTT